MCACVVCVYSEVLRAVMSCQLLCSGDTTNYLDYFTTPSFFLNLIFFFYLLAGISLWLTYRRQFESTCTVKDILS